MLVTTQVATGTSGISAKRSLRVLVMGTLVFVSALMAMTITTSAMSLESKLEETRSEAESIEHRLEDNKGKQQVTTERISEYTEKIRALDKPLRELDRQIEQLTARIAAGKARLRELRSQRQVIAERLKRLEAELEESKIQLQQRLVNIYTDSTASGGSSSSIFLSFGGQSFSDWLAQQGLIEKIAQSDHEIMTAVDELKGEVTDQRRRVRRNQLETQTQVTQVEADEREVSAKRAEVRAKQQKLERIRGQKSQYLSRLEENEQHLHDDLESLEAAEQALKAAIAAGAAAPGMAAVPGGPSPAGLIWPTSGFVISPYGPRWGRLHAGIDIATPAGTPIYAAAAGVVTYNTSMSGYGNLVIVQHAGGLSTAYAHQSTIVAQYGQFVPQGALLGYVGCTGHCYGDHLHFETRINGAAVDPMQYL